MIKANHKKTTPKKTAKNRFKAMTEARNKKTGDKQKMSYKKGKMKASISSKKSKNISGRKTKLSGTFSSKAITPKKAKVVKHKNKGRV